MKSVVLGAMSGLALQPLSMALDVLADFYPLVLTTLLWAVAIAFCAGAVTLALLVWNVPPEEK
jgi:hypothetical protein